jgi:serine/threonine protein kinase
MKTLCDYTDNDNNFYLFLKYINAGTLLNLIKKTQGIDENKAFKYFKQAISAIMFLYENNLVHRDLKPENLPKKKYIEIKLEASNFNKTNLTNNLTNNKNIPSFLNDIPPPTFFNKVQTPSYTPPSTKSKNISLYFSYQKIAPLSSEFFLLSSNNDDNHFDSVLDMIQKKNRKITNKEEGKFHMVSKSEFINLVKNMIDKTPEISISIAKSNNLDSIKEESSDNRSKNKANKSSSPVNIQKNSRNNLSVQSDNYNKSLFFNTSNQVKQKDRMDRSMNESKRIFKLLKNKSTVTKENHIDPKVTNLNKE